MESARDKVFETYEKSYQKIRQFFDADMLETAIEQAQDMLNDSGIPRWHRIQCYLLLAASVKDKLEAAEYMHRAETHWVQTQMVMRRQPHNAADEEGLAHLRSAIDTVRTSLAEEEAEEQRAEELAQLSEIEQEYEDDEDMYMIKQDVAKAEEEDEHDGEHGAEADAKAEAEAKAKATGGSDEGNTGEGNTKGENLQDLPRQH